MIISAAINGHWANYKRYDRKRCIALKMTASRSVSRRAVNQNIVRHTPTCVKIYGLFLSPIHPPHIS